MNPLFWTSQITTPTFMSKTVDKVAFSKKSGSPFQFLDLIWNISLARRVAMQSSVIVSDLTS